MSDPPSTLKADVTTLCQAMVTSVVANHTKIAPSTDRVAEIIARHGCDTVAGYIAEVNWTVAEVVSARRRIEPDTVVRQYIATLFCHQFDLARLQVTDQIFGNRHTCDHNPDDQYVFIIGLLSVLIHSMIDAAASFK